MPTDLTYAIAQGVRIISWQDNMQKDEVPPVWMFTLDDELEFWFEEVEAARDARFNGPHYEEGSMISNDLVRR